MKAIYVTRFKWPRIPWYYGFTCYVDHADSMRFDVYPINFVLMLKAYMKLKIKWTCSNFVKHQHRFKFAAWLCGKIQYQMARWNFLQNESSNHST